MRRTARVVVAICLVALPVASARAVEIDLTLAWRACPYLLGTAASAAMRRLDVPTDYAEDIAEFACDVAEAYFELRSDPPDAAAARDDPETAKEIFCRGSSLDYCAGVSGASPMSAAFRCWINGLSVEDCAANAIRSY